MDWAMEYLVRITEMRTCRATMDSGSYPTKYIHQAYISDFWVSGCAAGTDCAALTEFVVVGVAVMREFLRFITQNTVFLLTPPTVPNLQ